MRWPPAGRARIIAGTTLWDDLGAPTHRWQEVGAGCPVVHGRVVSSEPLAVGQALGLRLWGLQHAARTGQRPWRWRPCHG